MATLDGGTSRARTIRILTFAACFLVPTGAVLAQSVHPFAAPATIDAFTLTATAALLDVNRDGSADAVVPGLFMGTMAAMIDEHGGGLAANVAGPGQSTAGGAPMLASVIALAGGRVDDDELEDLVSVSSLGSLHFHKNLGSTRMSATNFAPDIVVDDFQAAYPIQPPFVSYSFPFVRVVDYDGDGLADVVIGGGPVDRWGGAVVPGFVGLYKGDGLGGFQVLRYGLAGSVVDVEVADLDNDGVADCLVVLQETGSLGSFSYDLVHIELGGDNMAMIGYPQNVGPGRMTALAMADVIGDGNNDYILTNVALGGSITTSDVYCFEGDGQGNVNSSAWIMLTLPANQTGLGDFVSSVQAGDFNRDGHVDLAVLRGFVQAPPAFAATSAIRADSEILVVMGPDVATKPVQTIPLPGYTRFSSTDSHLFTMLPLMGEPDGLHVFDLGGDRSLDLLVAGVRSNSGTGSSMLATVRNTTPPQLGDAWLQKIGEPSGGLATRPARIGFEGGRPRPGNADFACTIQNVQGGCLVGLMWSQFGSANLFSMHGLDFHLAPEEFGYARLASGTLAANGFHSYALPIPNSAALIGDAGAFQYCYYDHVAGVFGGTQATGLWIGN